MNGALIGRSMELEALSGCLKASIAGEGTAATVQGEPGIGKSRLLRAFAERARAFGAEVLWGRASELESNRPFRPLLQALAGAGMTDWSDPGRLDLEMQMVDRILDQMEEFAATGPLAVVVDDLQWADPSTLATLHSLLSRLPGLPMVLVVATRSQPKSRAMESLLEELVGLPCLPVRLHPLQPEEVAALVAGDLDAQPTAALMTQMNRAGGNPFYLKEYLRFLREEGAIELHDGVAHPARTTLSADLSETIFRKLRFLDAGTRDLLHRASVLGSTFLAVELQALTGLTPDLLIGPLKQAVEAELLSDRQEGFSFRHDLVREAFYRQIPTGLRSTFHLQAAHALSGIGAPKARIATQFGLGALPGDRRAIGALREAAAETSLSSPAIAIGFLEQAIELSVSQAEVDSLRVELAPILVGAGRSGEAREMLEEVLLREHDHELDLDLHFTMGRLLFLLGDRSESVAEHVQASALPGIDDADRSVVHVETALARLFGEGDVVGAAAEAERAMELADAASDDIARAMALCAQSCMHNFRGELSAAVATSEEALRLHRTAAPGKARLLPTLRDPQVFRGMALLEADRLLEGRRAFRTAIRLNAGSATGLAHVYHYWVGLALYYSGEWDDAEAELESGLSLADEWRNRTGALAAHALLALMAFHRGTHPLAALHLERCERHFSENGPDFGLEWMLLAKASLAGAGGNQTEACQTLAGIWQVFGALQLGFHLRTLGADLVRLGLATGKPSLAREVSGELNALAVRETVPSVQGAALHCRGLIEEDTELLAGAVAAYRDSGRPLPLGSSAEDAGVLMLRVSGPEGARSFFGEALSSYRQAGADWDAARVLKRMREAGIRRGVRARRARPAAGWESLTPTEIQVAGLVAEGLSNPAIGERLFISRRTVQTHVSHILAKLNLTSRTALAALTALRFQGETKRHSEKDP